VKALSMPKKRTRREFARDRAFKGEMISGLFRRVPSASWTPRPEMIQRQISDSLIMDVKSGDVKNWRWWEMFDL
jgi:hypothetical protein